MTAVIDSGFTPTPSSAGSYRLPTDRNTGSAFATIVAPSNLQSSINFNYAPEPGLENESVDVGSLIQQPNIPASQVPNSESPAPGRLVRADRFGNEPLFDPARDAEWLASGIGVLPSSEASSARGSHRSAEARVVPPQALSPISSSPPLVFQAQPLAIQSQLNVRASTPLNQPTSFSLPNLTDQTQFATSPRKSLCYKLYYIEINCDVCVCCDFSTL